ncbi:hypothetical protein PHYBLDRAFT_174995 [Phycomyces blakesleeanus NRRL 1555(-)]|uniref:Uncharacterized protein n=1 Tax=Phycomyces blakesleeanus (strain ATCC 8743b / DSM 1359 / FGSC 10004 / NBRC 33097 / NRRL 1555) TaxID=763407 RepID=A0A167JTS2_PHYB8|nr:hypothetical protein PHYBLDRAFT_174990 [Phycomyces blakesleeanus NRRL 1555(-)]XP_018284738.1 hypothetical protein PHYBLDRAFT_174992 [Phycomyces blakesleeanus NRRL 1555(-)]XP_018284739.1 hypothetical protein PHYBLDRAFT_174993 [Phycomyces blakesleeanus NRRL 1555(-)]XP_018284741.1 hypothetical protein PHYBLDRAFT_174995 [Phycomyces blakesleeanus NRRL 1555(-)]OAD66696.1 hypothetical protein PHYBLDRAFT_174990 [Phycomyces blakesleeanus NRRL 1555(-)]OAD66698.1 hypothetical protein PHYBLDRAFT_174992|eukprot:XP_018284736.1 hypothetical protein PHYBLDRAFT_174990 [Phycomyces blakesleeanus NRRL 1555(-)]
MTIPNRNEDLRQGCRNVGNVERRFKPSLKKFYFWFGCGTEKWYFNLHMDKSVPVNGSCYGSFTIGYTKAACTTDWWSEIVGNIHSVQIERNRRPIWTESYC